MLGEGEGREHSQVCGSQPHTAPPPSEQMPVGQRVLQLGFYFRLYSLLQPWAVQTHVVKTVKPGDSLFAAGGSVEPLSVWGEAAGHPEGDPGTWVNGSFSQEPG